MVYLLSPMLPIVPLMTASVIAADAIAGERAQDPRRLTTIVWAGLVLWVGPAMAAISLGVTVLVSARVKTVQEAFQIAGVIVIPVVVLVISQAAGLMVMSPLLLAAGGGVCWVIAVLVLRLGTRAVSRSRLGERLRPKPGRGPSVPGSRADRPGRRRSDRGP